MAYHYILLSRDGGEPHLEGLCIMRSLMILCVAMLVAGCARQSDLDAANARNSELQGRLDEVKKTTAPTPTPAPTAAASSAAHIMSGIPAGTSACVESTASTTVGLAADLKKAGEINGDVTMTSTDGRVITVSRTTSTTPTPQPQTIRMETSGVVEHRGILQHEGKLEHFGKIEMSGDLKVDGKIVSSATVKLDHTVMVDGKVAVAGTLNTNEKIVPVYLDPCTRELRAIK